MDQKFEKFSSKETKIEDDLQDKKAKRFSVKKEQLEKDSEDVSINRTMMALFGTEALASMGYIAFSVANTINNGFSMLTLTAAPASFFVFNGIKHMIQYYKKYIKKDKTIEDNIEVKVDIENNEKGMIR